MNIVTVISYLLSSFVYGIIAALVIMLLIYCVLKVLNKNYNFTPPILIGGALATILLAYNATLLFGAMSVKDGVEETAEVIDQTIQVYDSTMNDNAQQIHDSLTARLPLIDNFIDTADYAANTGKGFVAIADILVDNINSYIWERVFWIIGIIVVTIIIAIVFESKGGGSGNYSRRRGRDSERPAGRDRARRAPTSHRRRR